MLPWQQLYTDIISGKLYATDSMKIFAFRQINVELWRIKLDLSVAIGFGFSNNHPHVVRMKKDIEIMENAINYHARRNHE